MDRRVALTGVAVCLASLAMPLPATGQSDTQRPPEQGATASRAAELVRQQEEKAAQVKPLGPNKAEAIVIRLQRTGVLTGFPTGFYPWFGSVLGGGGFAAGGGWRDRVGTGSIFNVLAGWSIANYKLLQTGLTRSFADGRRRIALDAKWIDAPDVNFYGIGNDTREAALTSYLYNPTRVGGSAEFGLSRFVSIGGGAEYLDVDSGPGDGSPPIDAVFTPDEVPGLNASADYGIGRVFAAFDWRDRPDNTRRGGLYRVEWIHHASQTSAFDNFQQVEIDLRQSIPLVRENWVIALRSLITLSERDSDAVVPFFMLPYLGSGGTLRGYPTRRFIDHNTLLMQAEFRWLPSRFVDMAFFYDAGKVAAARGDLDFNDLHTDGGVGIRFHGPRLMVFRLDVAKGAEGLRFVWATTLF